ncbi:MAG: hypothetical protein EOO26_12295 [Comamonadaceae bacterium]|nr:MAG: hypothetical protein EOO26_12295 [Comamonadaceae bacterium]
MRCCVLSCALAGLVAVAACTPTFNWRDVPVGDGGLVALLPCKADRGSREVALDGRAATVQVAGCEAGGATFAVAVAEADNPVQAQAWLASWSASVAAQGDGAGKRCLKEASVPRAAPTPTALELDTSCAAPRPGHPQMLWFAQPLGGKVLLYQATMVDGPAEAEVWRTFIEGLRLP